jgi:hypothetical protein
VSILFALLDITPETHLVMFDGMSCAVPRRISPPRTAGDSLSSSPRSIPIVKSCSEEGKVSIMFIFALLRLILTFDVLRWGG